MLMILQMFPPTLREPVNVTAVVAVTVDVDVLADDHAKFEGTNA